MIIEERLKKLGYSLPPPSPPAGNYVSVVRQGSTLWLSGVGSRGSDGTVITGKLGVDLSTAEGYLAATRCALNILTRIKDEILDLDKVIRILKVVGNVNSSPNFFEQAQVIDGASDLFVELFGEKGKHARTAQGLVSLPGNNAVIVECVVEISCD